MWNLIQELPDRELDAFLKTITEAANQARQGDAASGYEVLLLALHGAKQGQAKDLAGAEELARCYCKVMERYARLFAVGRA